jgi:pyruvate/2-oxoglutarate dehydrogenase complex dihydrolipoamide acyltransferase (E2) component
MLQPFEVKSPFAGSIVSILAVGSKIKAGGLLARISDASGMVQELRSPVDGTIESLPLKEGETVTAGQTMVSLTPDRTTVSDALRALAYIGTKDDLSLIDAYANNAAKDADLKQVAVEAAKSIRARTAATTAQ